MSKKLIGKSLGELQAVLDAEARDDVSIGDPKRKEWLNSLKTDDLMWMLYQYTDHYSHSEVDNMSRMELLKAFYKVEKLNEARGDGLYKAALYSNGTLITEGAVEASSKSAANEKAWNDWGKEKSKGKSGIEFKVTELGNPKMGLSIFDKKQTKSDASSIQYQKDAGKETLTAEPYRSTTGNYYTVYYNGGVQTGNRRVGSMMSMEEVDNYAKKQGFVRLNSSESETKKEMGLSIFDKKQTKSDASSIQYQKDAGKETLTAEPYRSTTGNYYTVYYNGGVQTGNRRVGSMMSMEEVDNYAKKQGFVRLNSSESETKKEMDQVRAEYKKAKEAGDSKKAKELSDKLEDLGDYSSYSKTDSPDLPYLYNDDQQAYMDSRLNAWRGDKSEDPARKHNKRAFRMIAKEPMARVWVEGNDVHAESGFTPQTARVSFSSKEEAEKFASRFK